MGALVNAAVVTVLFGLIDKVRGRSRRAVPLRRRA
jgi:hypothetical protein